MTLIIFTSSARWCESWKKDRNTGKKLGISNKPCFFFFVCKGSLKNWPPLANMEAIITARFITIISLLLSSFGRSDIQSIFSGMRDEGMCISLSERWRSTTPGSQTISPSSLWKPRSQTWAPRWRDTRHTWRTLTRADNRCEWQDVCLDQIWNWDRLLSLAAELRWGFHPRRNGPLIQTFLKFYLELLKSVSNYGEFFSNICTRTFVHFHAQILRPIPEMNSFPK